MRGWTTRSGRRSGMRGRCTSRCGRYTGFRFHKTILYNSIYFGDDQMLVNTHVYGVPAAGNPVWHLRKIPGGEIAATYLGAFERVWETAVPVREAEG
jgi:hypothetical protein